MSLLESQMVQCPYCWEPIELLMDCSVNEQEYVEDCSVCCRPIVVTVLVDDEGFPELSVRSEND